MITVSVPAATTALTTLATFKEEMKIASNDEDGWVLKQIEGISRFVVSYLGVVMATNGTATLGRETLVETIRHEHARGRPWHLRSGIRRSALLLARSPVTSVVSVVQGGTTFDPEDYEVDGAAGLLMRVSGDISWSWHATTRIIVTYVAGWLLPADANRDLPADIEDAVIALLKASWFARRRDPALVSESIPGIREYRIGTTWHGADALPSDVAMRLDRYRNYVAG